MGAARCQKLGETDFFASGGKDLVNFNFKKGSPAWTFSYQKRLSGVDIFIFISKKALRRGHFHIKKGFPVWTFSYLFQTRLSGVDIFISKKALKALLCGHFHTRMKIENTNLFGLEGSWGKALSFGEQLPPVLSRSYATGWCIVNLN